MTPIELTRQALGHLGLSERELMQVRDLVDIQADIVVRGFMERHGKHYEELLNSEGCSNSFQAIHGTRLVGDTTQPEQGTAD